MAQWPCRRICHASILAFHCAVAAACGKAAAQRPWRLNEHRNRRHRDKDVRVTTACSSHENDN